MRLKKFLQENKFTLTKKAKEFLPSSRATINKGIPVLKKKNFINFETLLMTLNSVYAYEYKLKFEPSQEKKYENFDYVEWSDFGKGGTIYVYINDKIFQNKEMLKNKDNKFWKEVINVMCREKWNIKKLSNVEYFEMVTEPIKQNLLNNMKSYAIKSKAEMQNDYSAIEEIYKDLFDSEKINKFINIRNNLPKTNLI